MKCTFSTLSRSEQTLVRKLGVRSWDQGVAFNSLFSSGLEFGYSFKGNGTRSWESMETKRKHILTLASTEQMKMQKIRITHDVVKERNQHTPIVDWEHTTQETHVSSMSDRRLSFDRGDYVEVGRLIKSTALEIASCVEFLVEGIGKKDKEVKRLINDKHEVISEVSLVTNELEKEKTARLNVEGELLKRSKQSSKMKICYGLMYHDSRLNWKWKKSNDLKWRTNLPNPIKSLRTLIGVFLVNGRNR